MTLRILASGESNMNGAQHAKYDVTATLAMVIESSRSWAWAENGQELFQQVARMFQVRLAVDSGYIVYRKTALWRDSDEEHTKIYAPWGRVIPTIDIIASRMEKQLAHQDPLQYLSEQWLTLDQVPEPVRTDWVQWGFSSGGSWPLTLGGERVGALILRRSLPDCVDDSTLMHLISLQISLVLELLRVRRIAEDTSQRDLLTGVYNRRGILGSFPHLADQARLHDRHVVLGIFDVNDFKQINDRLGHPYGDQILRLVGDALRSNVRPTDLVGRWGGDEFVVVMAVDRDTVLSQVVERVRKGLEGVDQGVAVSAGWAHWGPDGMSWDDLYQAADRRLYYHKRTRRGPYRNSSSKFIK